MSPAAAAAAVEELVTASSPSLARRRIWGPLGKGSPTPVVVAGLFQGYLAYNMARKALAVAAPGLQGGEGLTKTDLGLVSSSFTAAYGASKFAGSVITDHVSCRALFSLGLIFTGVLCFVFSLSSDLPRLMMLWSFHGIVQGAGWPSLAKICVERVPQRLQGRVWALLSAAGNAGHVCAGPLLLLLGGGWRRIMRGAGAVALFSGVLAYVMTGEDVVTPRDEDDEEEVLPWAEFKDWRAGVAKVVEWIFVVKRILSLEVVALFISDSLIYFVIKGLADWSVLSLTETKGLAEKEAVGIFAYRELGAILGSFLSGLVSDDVGGLLTNLPTYIGLAEKEAVGVFFYCELGAILGSFASGWVSDQVGGLRTSTSSAFALLALPFLYATHKMPIPGLAPLGAAYFMLGVFINGPKTLSGIALRQIVPPSMAGTAMGVQGLVGQVGASWAGAPVGFVAQHYGWGAIRHLWAASLVTSAGLLSIPGVMVKARRLAELRRGRKKWPSNPTLSADFFAQLLNITNASPTATAGVSTIPLKKRKTGGKVE